jgi:ribosomal protein S18 acetylase RimI-like enzyme
VSERERALSSAGVMIRRAVASDTAAIGRLAAALVRVHHDFDPQRFIDVTPQTERSYGGYVNAQRKEPESVVLVAERDGVVLGYAWGAVEGIDYMSLRGPAGVLYDIVVDATLRGQGIGRQLLDAILRALAALGAPRVVLSTASRNEAAQRLFASVGFRQTMVEMTRESDAGAGG